MGDGCSHHCTIPALQNQTQTTWWETGARTTAPFLLCRIITRPPGGRRVLAPLHPSCSAEPNPDHLVGDGCSHHCTIPALQNHNQTTWWETGARTTAPFLLCRTKPRPLGGRRVLSPLHYSCSAESNPDHLVGDGCSHHCTLPAPPYLSFLL